jgi:membrane protein required for colicin V production
MGPHTGFNNLDYIVIGIVLLSGLLALMRGFTRELFSLIAWVGAYFAAVRFFPHAVPFAHRYIHNDQAAEWAAIAAIFVIVLIVLMIIGSIICSFVKGSALTAIDRSLGFLYGLARGVLVVGLVYLGLVTVMWPDIDTPPSPPAADVANSTEQPQDKNHSTPPDLLMQAKTRPALDSIAKTLKVLLPKEIIDKTIKGAEDQKAALEKAEKQKMLDTLSTPEPPTPVVAPTQGTTP